MSFWRRLIYGLFTGFIFFTGSLMIGIFEHKLVATLSLVGTSIALEAQPASVASIPLGFHPLSGALISILGNLIPVPVLVLMLDEIIHRWAWYRRRLQKAEVWSHKYGKYGVWVLLPLSPVLGSYICISLGYIMRWSPRLVLCSVLVGMFLSSFIIAYGGESVVRLLRPYI